jgi:hypothetical protein
LYSAIAGVAIATMAARATRTSVNLFIFFPPESGLLIRGGQEPFLTAG